MRLFGRRERTESEPDSRHKAAAILAEGAQRQVEERRRGARLVRVEDYLAALGAITGEAALVAAGFLDIEATDLPPGSPVFGPTTNQVLSGDVDNLAEVPSDSVVGILIHELVPGLHQVADFDHLTDLYAQVAAGVGSVTWGEVALSVPDDNRPSVLPLRVAFEMRPLVESTAKKLGIPAAERHIPCALALAGALKQVQQPIAKEIALIDKQTALRLALEVVFGTAKMVPMSKRAMKEVNRGT